MPLHVAWRPGGSREESDGVLRKRVAACSLLAPFQGARREGGGRCGCPVVAPPANFFRASGSEGGMGKAIQRHITSTRHARQGMAAKPKPERRASNIASTRRSVAIHEFVGARKRSKGGITLESITQSKTLNTCPLIVRVLASLCSTSCRPHEYQSWKAGQLSVWTSFEVIVTGHRINRESIRWLVSTETARSERTSSLPDVSNRSAKSIVDEIGKHGAVGGRLGMPSKNTEVPLASTVVTNFGIAEPGGGTSMNNF